jgi:hypothetical protein
MGAECDSSYMHNKQVVHLKVKSAQSMMLSQLLKCQPWTPSKNWSNNRNNKCKDVIYIYLQNLSKHPQWQGKAEACHGS